MTWGAEGLGWGIQQGDALACLRQLPSEAVHCVVTSPPYWGLRDYGVSGQLGLEPTPGEYVAKMVEVFREVWRVLRKDGTLWLNLGDAYRNKRLIGIPWRVALALQEDGWWLRSDIIWHKPSVMPESVTDRPTKAHEYVFLLTKSARYFYDAEAVAEGTANPSGIGRVLARWGGQKAVARPISGAVATGNEGANAAYVGQATRNRRTVWRITTKPYPGAHFAVFPPELPEICIKAGTSETGCCPGCGAPWERVVEGGCYAPDVVEVGVRQVDDSRQDKARRLDGKSAEWRRAQAARRTTGWRPTCEHDSNPIPCTVLDPFAGSGTTLMVALRLGRAALGIELNPDYVELSRARIEGV